MYGQNAVECRHAAKWEDGVEEGEAPCLARRCEYWCGKKYTEASKNCKALSWVGSRESLRLGVVETGPWKTQASECRRLSRSFFAGGMGVQKVLI